MTETPWADFTTRRKGCVLAVFADGDRRLFTMEEVPVYDPYLNVSATGTVMSCNREHNTAYIALDPGSFVVHPD